MNAPTTTSDPLYWSDAWWLRHVAPKDTPVIENISCWDDLAKVLDAPGVPDHSLSAIVISSHGAGGAGVTASKQWLSVGTLTPAVANLIARKLKPDGVFIVAGCTQAAM
jgi:hypothetical protein